MQTSGRPTRTHRLYWWKEAILIVAFYLLYSWTRNQFGSARIDPDGMPEHSFNNALRVIRWEKALGLFQEATMQSWFTGSKAVMQFWNTYYGVAHFVVTIGVFVILYWKRPDVFPIWRNTILITTGLAIIGFSLFPLMPPRLLDAPCPGVKTNLEGEEVSNFGGACIATSERPDRETTSSNRVPPGTEHCEEGPFGFTDSLACYGGPWSFNSNTIKELSNQYAAMPSLHIGWATWSALAMWPLLTRRRAKAAMLLYPLVTLTCIIVTANHYWLDGIGGLVTLWVGFVLGWALHVWNQRRLDRKFEAKLDAEGLLVTASDESADEPATTAGPATTAAPVPGPTDASPTTIERAEAP
jgi:hypothetical protein